MRHLIWLEWRKLRNALRHLCRSPARLVLTLLLALLVLLSVAGHLVALFAPRPEALAGKPLGAAPVAARVALSLFGLLLYSSYSVLDRGLRGELFSFGAAEVDVLFPSPLPRWQVLVLRLCLEYLKLAFISLLLVLWLSPQLVVLGLRPTGPMLLRAGLALALLLAFLLNVSTTLSLLTTHQAARLGRLPLLVKVFFGAAAVTFIVAWSGSSAPDTFAALRGPVATLLLFPLAATWQILLAPLTGEPAHAQALLAALAALAAASGLVLLTRRENIYEPTADLSLLRHEVRQAVRGGDLGRAKALLAARRHQHARGGLAPFGRGAGALLWKDLAGAWRTSRFSILFLALLAVTGPLVLSRFGHARDVRAVVEYGPLVTLYFLLLTLGVVLRQQRGELQRADLLKPLPLPAWQVVGLAALPFSLVWALVLAVALSLLVLIDPWASPRLCLALGLGLPPFVWLVAVTSTGLSCLFPDPTNAVQNFVSGLLLLLLLAILMGLHVGVGVALWVLGQPGWVIGAVVGWIALVLSAPALLIAAALLRRFDPTD